MTTLPAPAQKEGPGTLASLSQDTWEALITDCYWGEFDAYGAFLWHHMPSEIRRNLVDKFPFLAAYGAVLSHATQEDYGSHSEPSYLDPLPIGALDNDELTNWVRKHPGLIVRLSSLRLAGLKLTSKERLTLTKSALAGSSEPLPRLERLAGSSPRRFAKTAMVAFLDDKQEAELSLMGNVGPDVAAWLPSLYWFDRLGNERASQILARFTARELASAWIGPRATLDRLESLLPTSKRRLLVAFRRTTPPQRTSPSFYQLHRDAVTALLSKPDPSQRTPHAKSA